MILPFGISFSYRPNTLNLINGNFSPVAPPNLALTLLFSFFFSPKRKIFAPSSEQYFLYPLDLRITSVLAFSYLHIATSRDISLPLVFRSTSFLPFFKLTPSGSAGLFSLSVLFPFLVPCPSSPLFLFTEA